MQGLREFVIFGLIAAGCSRGATAPPPQTAAQPPPAGHAMPGAPPGHGEMMGMCPMEVQGTQVRTEDTADGIALVFTTSDAGVADLRARVRRMAEMHTRMAEMHGGGAAGAGSAGTMDHGAGMMMAMVPSTATASDIPGGARLELRPHDPAQLDALRTQVHTHAQQMASGQCPMMGEHGAAHAHR